MTILSVENLSITTEKGLPLVSNISFTIGYKEIVGLMGPSGCGKTTTAFAITRLLPSSFSIDGSIYFDGKDLLTCREIGNIRGAKISYVLQDPFASLHPAKKISTQINEAPQIHKQNDPKWICKLVDHLQISQLLNRYPHQLSGGQRQRVCLAIALSCKPMLLIADEPTTALDAILHKEILDLLSEIRELFHISILFISHDRGATDYLCDRILTMKEGRTSYDRLPQDHQILWK